MHTVPNQERTAGQDAEDLNENELDDNDLDDEEDFGAQTIVMSDDDDDYSDADISMEVNVEKLVAQFEKADSTDIHRRAEIRRRLEELAEEGELDDTYAIDFDD